MNMNLNMMNMKYGVKGMAIRLCIAFVTCLLSVSPLFANPISLKQAQEVAQRALHGEVVSVNSSAEARSRMGLDATSVEVPSFYLFNGATGEGFALVSGDDELPLLLGYSRTGQMDAEGAGMPDALQAWLQGIDRFVALLRDGQVKMPTDMLYADEAGTPVVEPLCSSKWGQTTPYNLLCPSTDSDNHAPTGCVATAMAQIMYRWGWPASGRGKVTYNATGYGALSVDFSQSTYDWLVMKDSYSLLDVKKSSTQTMAKLNYDCGVACHMQYAANGSGTQGQYALEAFARYFRYKASMLRYVFRECCESQEEFNNIIYRELNAGRPIQCNAASATGTGSDAAGHSYILDGYDSRGFVHINWGWSGYYDGYYAITLMNPESYQFSESQRLVVGIQPDYENTDSVLPQARMVLEGSPEVKVSSAVQRSTFAVYLDTLWNMSASSVEVEVGIGLYDLQGNLLENTVVNSTLNTISLLSFYGTIFDSGISCRVKDSYDAGDYVLRVMCRIKGYDDWVLPDVVGGQKQNWIPVYIHEKKLYFNQVSSSIESVGMSLDSRYTADDATYDLMGRRVKNTARQGIYIQGGKKILVH